MTANDLRQTPNSVRTFYILILTQVISSIGSRMTSLALSIYLYSTLGDVTPLALTALFALLPGMLGAAMAGVIADRFDRRKVMIAADAGQIVGTVILLLSFTSGSFQVWHLYLVTFIQATFALFQTPAFTASVSTMIPDDQRNRANALMQLVGPLAGIIAPPLAGTLYALVGLTGVILIDVFSFLFAVGVLLVVRIPKPLESAEGRASRTSMWRELTGGFAYLWKMRPLLWLVIYFAFINFLFAGAEILQTPYLLARTGSEAALGLLLAITNAGAIIGSIVLGSWRGSTSRMAIIFVGIVITSVFFALFGTSRTTLTLGVTGFLFMFTLPMVNASVMGILQVKVPQDLQGRVFAVLNQFAIFLMPLSYLLIGPLADTVVEPAVGTPGWQPLAPLFGSEVGAGMGLIIFGAGVLSFLLSLIVFAVPSIRHLERTIPDHVAPVLDQSTLSPRATGEQAAAAPSS